MNLALFDLDETLIAGDSDNAWFEFLLEERLIDEARYRPLYERFYRQYRSGVFDVEEYLGLVCTILKSLDPARICEYRARFVATRIQPLIQRKAMDLVELHRQRGDLLLVITSTIDFVVQPIVDLFGIPELIAPVAERRNGSFTGGFVGTPSFREGKVTRLEEWLGARGLTLDQSHFYSDSQNDLPLLERVTHPVAVDPDPELRRIAEARGWSVISLRD